jgi:hypothetical protein
VKERAKVEPRSYYSFVPATIIAAASPNESIRRTYG